MPYLWNKAGDPQFLFRFWNKYSKSLSVRSRSLKKSIKYKIFVRTSLREVFRTVELSCGTTYYMYRPETSIFTDQFKN